MIMNKTTKIDESIIVIALPVPSLVSENLFKASVFISTTYAFLELLVIYYLLHYHQWLQRYHLLVLFRHQLLYRRKYRR